LAEPESVDVVGVLWKLVYGVLARVASRSGELLRRVSEVYMKGRQTAKAVGEPWRVGRLAADFITVAGNVGQGVDNIIFVKVKVARYSNQSDRKQFILRK